jgi:hypothetical protein
MAVEDDHYIYLWSAGSIALSESEKAEVLTESLKLPPSIEIVDGARWSYFRTHAREPKLTNTDEVHETISVLKVGKSTGPNCTTQS